MTPIKNIDTQLFRQGVRPMRSLARNERIHTLARGNSQFTPSPASDNTNSRANFLPARNNKHARTHSLFESLGQLSARDAGVRLKPQELAMVEKERSQFLQTQRATQLRIVAKFGMRI